MTASSSWRAFRSGLFLPAVAVALLPLSGSPLNPRTTQASGVQAALDSKLASAMASASGPLEVVVTFRKDTAPNAADVSVLQQIGITRGLTFKSLPIAGVWATPQQINALVARPEIRSVYLNAPLLYFNNEARELTGVNKVRASSDMTAENGGLPVLGDGVTVLINDSGVDGTHGDLQYGPHLIENALGTTNLHALVDILPVTYIEGVPNTDSNSGHGTHCAGTIGGTGAMSGGLYAGVAPSADLVGYGSGAALLVLDAIGGFDYALTETGLDIDVISNSWGSDGDFDPADPVNVASYLAYESGMTVVFAAGNAGPAENTHNPYAKAPWVISVAAGTKQGVLADFSSRGTAGVGGTFTMDGQTWTWEDRPTVTAPGVSIVSTRAIAPVSSLGLPDDGIDPLLLPYYTHMDGTSMATPHVAGIVALLLEANPSLSPADVKSILQLTATNMPGMEPWEVGAGYVNAYAAVDQAFRAPGYGGTLNLWHTFNSNVTTSSSRVPFTVTYNPLLAESNAISFSVAPGTTELVARIDAYGLIGEGNTVNLVLIAPDGTEHGSGVPILFALETARTVSVPGPAAGQWMLEVRGLRGDPANPTAGLGLPEAVAGTLTYKTAGSITGLNDIANHPAASAIKIAVSDRLVDGYANGNFRPDQALTRAQLAQYLTRGAAVRQLLPVSGAATFSDVSAADLPFVQAAVAAGAALKDREQDDAGVLLPTSPTTFSPGSAVTRADLAYALVQSLGISDDAAAQSAGPLTAVYNGERIPIEDASSVPSALRGHVQMALDLNIMNASFYMTQSLFDLTPTVHARFYPGTTVSRAAYAVTISRFFSAYLAQ